MHYSKDYNITKNTAVKNFDNCKKSENTISWFQKKNINEQLFYYFIFIMIIHAPNQNIRMDSENF